MGEDRDKSAEDVEYLYRIGIDGEIKGPLSLRRLDLLPATKKRVLFIRAMGADCDDDEGWTSYGRFRYRRADPGPSREWLTDVSRTALARIVFGIFMVVVGVGLSYVSPWIFVGLIVVGIFVIGRAAWRWIDGRT